MTRAASVEPLGPTECRRLMATARLARVGFTDGAMPAIVPVRFAMHDDCALVLAPRAGALVAGVRGSVVVLQVDSFRDDLGPGWSVTAVGPSRVVVAAHEVARIDALGLLSRTSDPDACYIRVQLGMLSGWRVGPPAPAQTSASTSAGEAAMT